MLCKLILQTLLCVMLLSGTLLCAAEAAGPADTPDANKAMPAKTGPTAQKDAADSNASQVIISLGDQKLTAQQVAWRIPNPQDAQIARLAESWLETELMYAEAQRRGLTKEPRAAFFADLMRKTAFARELRREVTEAVKTTDQDVVTYYEKNKQTDPTLTTPGNLSFSHIATKTLEEAQAVLEKLKAGENINELAKKLSVASDAVLGGAVKQRAYSQIRQLYGDEFLEKLKAAEKGQFIGPVVAGRKNLYEVARKDGQTNPEPLPFEQVKDKLKSQLERARKQEAYQSLLDSLMKQAADKIVKSPRLIEAEKAASEQPRGRPMGPLRTAPTPPARTPTRKK